MNIVVREKNGVVILDLEGNININASNLVETIGWAIETKSKNILLNFEKVNLVDYIGISVLAIAYKNILNHKGKLKIYNTPRHVMKLFCLVGMNRVLDFYPNEDVALAQFKKESRFLSVLTKKLRRRFKRIDLRSRIEYWPKSTSGAGFYKGKILNLSAIGMFVIVDKAFPEEEILSTRLYLMPKPGIIEVETKVVWVADKEIQPLESPGMGLEFYNISSEQQTQIIDFVERHLIHTPEE